MYKNAYNPGPLMLYSAPSSFSSSIDYPTIGASKALFLKLYESVKFLATTWERTHYNSDILENQVKAHKQYCK